MNYFEVKKVSELDRALFKGFIEEKHHRVDFRKCGKWQVKVYHLIAIKKLNVYVDVVYFGDKITTRHLKIKKSLLLD